MITVNMFVLYKVGGYVTERWLGTIYVPPHTRTVRSNRLSALVWENHNDGDDGEWSVSIYTADIFNCAAFSSG